jgi:hypothetical protein
MSFHNEHNSLLFFKYKNILFNFILKQNEDMSNNKAQMYMIISLK